MLNFKLSALPSPTLNNNAYLFNHCSGKTPKLPSFNGTNCCLFINIVLMSCILTFCSPNEISTLASNQSVLLLIYNRVVGLAVLNLNCFNCSVPNNGICFSFRVSMNKKNQLFFNTSEPFNANTLPSFGLMNPECNCSIMPTNWRSAARSRSKIISLSPNC